MPVQERSVLSNLHPAAAAEVNRLVHQRLVPICAGLATNGIGLVCFYCGAEASCVGTRGYAYSCSRCCGHTQTADDGLCLPLPPHLTLMDTDEIARRVAGFEGRATRLLDALQRRGGGRG